jgi:hypothetical protein
MLSPEENAGSSLPVVSVIDAERMPQLGAPYITFRFNGLLFCIAVETPPMPLAF